MSYLKLNTLVLPNPARGGEISRQQQYTTRSTASGVIVGQKTNRRIMNFTLQWNMLTAAQWHDILCEAEKFTGELTFYNVRTNQYEKISVLISNVNEVPYMVDANGIPTKYSTCSIDICDLGEIATVVP